MVLHIYSISLVKYTGTIFNECSYTVFKMLNILADLWIDTTCKLGYDIVPKSKIFDFEM